MRVITTTEAVLTNASAGQEVIDILYTLGVNPEYLDDHRQVRTVVKPKACLLISNGETIRICPVGEKVNGCWAFSLNQLYLNLKDEEIRLSVLSTATFHVNRDCSIEEAVDIYNEQVAANPFADWKVISLIRM